MDEHGIMRACSTWRFTTREKPGMVCSMQSLGAVVRLNDVGVASGHCGVPAIIAAAVPSSTGGRPRACLISAPLCLCWSKLWRRQRGCGRQCVGA